MSLQDYANIGEIVGGIVVVISLMYVALQVRQNSQVLEKAVQSVRTQTVQNLVENFNFYRQLLMSEETRQVFIRGLDDFDSLEPSEKLCFNMIASAYVWTAWSYFEINRREGLIEDMNDKVFADMFRHSGFASWYSVYGPSVGGEYGRFLLQVRDEAQGKEYKPGDFSNILQGRIA